MAHAMGLRWLDELVEAGNAIDLGGDGYPFRHRATAGNVVQRIVDGPPEAKGRAELDTAALAACREDEWLLIEAFDES